MGRAIWKRWSGYHRRNLVETKIHCFKRLTIRHSELLKSSPSYPGQHMTTGEYYGGWARILKRAGVSHVGTHGIRHRSATDIANSGVPVKVGMALTAHKTVAMFMLCVHTEDEPVREAAELVANRRKNIAGAWRPLDATA